MKKKKKTILTIFDYIGNKDRFLGSIFYFTYVFAQMLIECF